MLIDEDGGGGECNTLMTMSDKSEEGIPSMRNPVSDERTSDSVDGVRLQSPSCASS